MNVLSYAKALMPVFVAGAYFLNQKFGVALPTGDEVLALITAVSSVLVYFVPNKPKA